MSTKQADRLGIDEDLSYYRSKLAAATTEEDRSYYRAAIKWCNDGCPGDAHDDSWGDYETGDFA